MLGPYTIAVLLCKLVPTQPGNWTPTWAPNWNFTESTVIQPTASKYFNPNHTYGLVSIDFQTGKRAACLWTESFRAHRAGHCHVPVTHASIFCFFDTTTLLRSLLQAKTFGLLTGRMPATKRQSR